MGVYIKGATLQQFERDAAVFLVHKDGRAYQLTYHDEKPFKVVEVKEPHGRLIDADFEEAHYTSMTTKPTPDVSQKDKENSLIIVKALQMARTVIEREGE